MIEKMKKKEKLRKGKWEKRNENWKGRCSNGKGRGSVSRKKYMKKGKIPPSFKGTGMSKEILENQICEDGKESWDNQRKEESAVCEMLVVREIH